MAVQLSNNRLALGMAISVLVHACAFFALVLLLQFHASTHQEIKNIEVRLAPSLPLPKPARTGKKLLTIPASAAHKIPRANIQDTHDSVLQPSTKNAETLPQPAEAVAGVAFPGAVVTQWSGPNGASNSPFRGRSSPQDAAQYQQAIAAQARQLSEQQAQFMMLQLQQLLAKRLDVYPVETGKCLLAESAEGASHKMSCDSAALHEVLSKDEKMVAEMLISLRGMGRMLKGFSVEIRAEKLGVILLYDGTTENLNSEPAGATAQ